MTAYWLKLGDPVPLRAWTPLERLAFRAAQDPALPPVEPDDFLYAARVRRDGVPDLHVYRHLLTGRYLNVDDLGGLWRFVGKALGVDGYAQIPTLAEALDRAELDRAERLALRTRRGPRRPVPAEAETDSPGPETGADPELWRRPDDWSPGVGDEDGVGDGARAADPGLDDDEAPVPEDDDEDVDEDVDDSELEAELAST